MKFQRLDRRITIQSQDDTRNNFGEVEKDYTTVATVWAQVIYKGGQKETPEAEQMFAQQNIEFFIRHPQGSFTITETDRVVFESRNYEILGQEEVGRREGLRLHCREKGGR